MSRNMSISVQKTFSNGLFKFVFLLLFMKTISTYAQSNVKGGTESSKQDYFAVMETEDFKYLSQISMTYQDMLAYTDSVCNAYTAAEQRNAIHFMTSIYSLVMESYVDKGDPAQPEFTTWMHPWRKFGGDNPHTIYRQVPVHENYSYKVTGKAGTAFYIGLQVYGYASGFNLATNNISSNTLVLIPDGQFEIYLSRTRPEGAKNWVQLLPGDHAFLTREYFRDRNNVVPGTFKVERIDSSGTTVSTYHDRLRNAESKLKEYTLSTFEITGLLKENSFNHFPAPDAPVKAPRYGGALYPTNDNTYDGFWMSLKKGQAVHLHGKKPQATYVSWVFYNRWYTTPDYLKINSFLTDTEVQYNSDGSYDIYISPEKVNHANWIDTGGLYEGSVAIRYLLALSKEMPKLAIIHIADIHK